MFGNSCVIRIVFFWALEGFCSILFFISIFDRVFGGMCVLVFGLAFVFEVIFVGFRLVFVFFLRVVFWLVSYCVRRFGYMESGLFISLFMFGIVGKCLVFLFSGVYMLVKGF